MASAVAEKTAEDLRKEIDELHRQQREITERLRDPRGLRRGGAVPGGPRPTVGPRPRPFVRPGLESEDQPAQKRRLLSTVVVAGEEIKPEALGTDAVKEQDPAVEGRPSSAGDTRSVRAVNPQTNGGLRRDIYSRPQKMENDQELVEPLPRVLPKNEDPSLVRRNQRMLGQLLGTLQKFREEDQKLSTTDSYMRRSDSLRRAEQKAREESERLRQQEREQIAEKRRRDLTLRARVAAKAEEKKLELLFLTWADHQKKLCNFLRTRTEPPIYYMPAKPLVDDAVLNEQRKEQAFQEWKSTRRAELLEHQKQIGEQYMANVEAELQRWQSARNARAGNNLANLQETMDKELETHRLENGPKPRRIPGSNEEEEDVEDIVAEDELMDEVLEVQERIDSDSTKLPDAGNGSPSPTEMQ